MGDKNCPILATNSYQSVSADIDRMPGVVRRAAECEWILHRFYSDVISRSLVVSYIQF